MIRVAHVLNSPGLGGVPRVAEALVRATDPARVSPHLFTLKPGSGPALLEDLDIPRRVASTASKATAMTELVAFLDHHRIDILHTHSFRPNLYGRMAGAVLRPAGLRIVAHYHNDYSDKWSDEALCLERHLAASTDAGLAVSKAVAAHVAQQVGLDCDVAENGIDRDRIMGGDRTAGRAALGASDDAFVIGLVGRICHQKGVDTFVEAAILAAESLPNAVFVVLGDAEDSGLQARLLDRVANTGHSGRIRFMGYRADMADMLAALDLLAAPSRWEGFGLMLAEAMCAGVPVVASEVGGMPDVLDGAGLLIPPDDPEALCGALRHLAGHPNHRLALSQAGRIGAERFDWTRTASQIAAVYDRVMER